jgi:hypothetical protein
LDPSKFLSQLSSMLGLVHERPGSPEEDHSSDDSSFYGDPDSSSSGSYSASDQGTGGRHRAHNENAPAGASRTLPASRLTFCPPCLTSCGSGGAEAFGLLLTAALLPTDKQSCTICTCCTEVDSAWIIWTGGAVSAVLLNLTGPYQTNATDGNTTTAAVAAAMVVVVVVQLR